MFCGPSLRRQCGIGWTFLFQDIVEEFDAVDLDVYYNIIYIYIIYNSSVRGFF